MAHMNYVDFACQLLLEAHSDSTLDDIGTQLLHLLAVRVTQFLQAIRWR